MESLQQRAKIQLPEESPIVPFAIRHAAVLMNRFHVNSSGRTAFETVCDRTYCGRLAPFGSSCFAQLLEAQKLMLSGGDGNGVDERHSDASVGGESSGGRGRVDKRGRFPSLSESSSSAPDSIAEAEAMDSSHVEKRILVGEKAEEPAEKRTRSPEKLSPPMFAGNIRAVMVDGECLETGDEEISMTQFGDSLAEWIKENWSREDGKEELKALEAAAQRLLDGGRMRPVKLGEASGWKQLSTTQVYDWRYRGGWIRRSRLVAREYRWLDPEMEQIYAPSSVASTTKVLAAMMMSAGDGFGLKSADVKDAYLMVPQKEKVFIIPPPSWKELHPEDEAWELLFCLPGQRIGARAWHDQTFCEKKKCTHIRAPHLCFGQIAVFVFCHTWMIFNCLARWLR